jgi:hypothetical protein
VSRKTLLATREIIHEPARTGANPAPLEPEHSAHQRQVMG